MAKDYAYLTRNVRPGLPTFVSGSGLEMCDSEGRILLDAGSQTSNLALGQCHPAVVRAAASQAESLLYASSAFSSRPFLELSERIVELAPEGLTAANLMMCDGSDAVETACKLARLYRWAPTMLAVRGAWHGESSGAIAFSPGYTKSLLATDRNIVLSAEPTLASLAELVEATPEAAGVVVDPVGVSNGLFPRSEIDTWLPRIRELCTRHDTLLIFDEVQTFGGFVGRTLFAAQELGVTPDVVCIAKAIGGGLPLAGVLCRRDLADLLSHNEAEFTNGGNPVSCAAALAFLDVYSEEHERFVRNATAFRAAVAGLAGSHTDLEVESHGFIATFRKRADRFRERWAAKAVSIALDEDMILRLTNLGQSVLVKPPIVTGPETAQTIATRLASVFERATEQTAGCGISARELRSAFDEAPQRRSSLDHFGDLLAALDVGCEVRSRTGEEIERLTRALPQMGVRVGRGFAVDSDDVEYEPVSGTPLDRYLAGGQPESIVNGLVVQQQRYLEAAHAHGIVIGGRWSQSAVVGSDLTLKLVDFEVAYSGPFDVLAAFEELYALLDLGAHVADLSLGARVVERMAPGLLARWPQTASHLWQGIRDLHALAETPAEAALSSSGP